MGVTWVEDRPNWKRRIHVRERFGSGPSGGLNSHWCAALRARPAKYLLGPGETSLADLTLPDESTSTRTLTWIFPLMVFLALFGTSGITCRTIASEIGRASCRERV